MRRGGIALAVFAAFIASTSQAETFFEKVDSFIAERETAYMEERLVTVDRSRFPEVFWQEMARALEVPAETVHELAAQGHRASVAQWTPVEISHNMKTARWAHGTYGSIVVIPYFTVAILDIEDVKVEMCQLILIADFDDVVFAAALQDGSERDILWAAFPGLQQEVEHVVDHFGGFDAPLVCEDEGLS